MKNFIQGSKRTSLTRSIQRSASSNEGKLHVLPIRGKWGVKREGADRFYRVVETKSKALHIAKDEAMSKGTFIVVVHNKDGRIADFKTYE